jgi:hypothetical protein
MRQEFVQLSDRMIGAAGMKKVTNTGGFCGSPKWMNDGRHVLAYC